MCYLCVWHSKCQCLVWLMDFFWQRSGWVLLVSPCELQTQWTKCMSSCFLSVCYSVVSILSDGWTKVNRRFSSVSMLLWCPGLTYWRKKWFRWSLKMRLKTSTWKNKIELVSFVAFDAACKVKRYRLEFIMGLHWTWIKCRVLSSQACLVIEDIYVLALDANEFVIELVLHLWRGFNIVCNI